MKNFFLCMSLPTPDVIYMCAKHANCNCTIFTMMNNEFIIRSCARTAELEQINGVFEKDCRVLCNFWKCIDSLFSISHNLSIYENDPSR